MIGYSAVAESPTLRIDHEELQEARWYSRDELTSHLKAGKIEMPSMTSVAYHLIARWYDAGDKGALDKLLGRDTLYREGR